MPVIPTTFLQSVTENFTDILGDVATDMHEHTDMPTEDPFVLTTLVEDMATMEDNAEVTTMILGMEETTVMEEQISSDVITNSTDESELTLKVLASSMDVFFLLINGMVIFLLQSGFAFLEAGSVRSKNTTNILIKNMLDLFIAGMAFWVTGYMFAYSDGNGFIGFEPGYLMTATVPVSLYAHWFFQFVFCATAATIVSGSLAERCDLVAYFTYSTVLSGVVYPIAAHWAWHEKGWLNQHGYTDFAGSGVVHLLGGVCAFVGALILGPRIGRFTPEGKPRDIPGHSVPLAAMGAFILMFGFFAFNGATEGAVSTVAHAEAVQRSVMATAMSGSSSAICTLLLFRFRRGQGRWSLLMTINGALTGMIASCASCNDIEPYMAAILGCGAAPVFLLVHHLMILLRVDDPLDAVAVHAGGGMYGVLMAPFMTMSGVFYRDDLDSSETLHKIWANLVGVCVIISWSAVTSVPMFYFLNLNNWLRVSPEMEMKGLDIIKHGEPAYPAQAWHEEQYSVSKDEESDRKLSYASAKSFSSAKSYDTTADRCLPPHMTSVPHNDENVVGLDNDGFDSEPDTEETKI